MWCRPSSVNLGYTALLVKNLNIADVSLFADNR